MADGLVPGSENDEETNRLVAELARLEADNKAIREEFAAIANDPDIEFSPEDLKLKFRKLLPAAWERLNYLIGNAESEAVQVSLIKFVFSVGLGQTKITDANAPDPGLVELLEALAVKEK